MFDLGVRVQNRNNLTIEIIRAQRFDVAYARLAGLDQQQRADCTATLDDRHRPCPADRVSLSPEALAYNPWQASSARVDSAVMIGAAEPMIGVDPSISTDAELSELTPVSGSPALSGLGVALIVPGTLLDVVA